MAGHCCCLSSTFGNCRTETAVAVCLSVRGSCPPPSASLLCRRSSRSPPAGDLPVILCCVNVMSRCVRRASRPAGERRTAVAATGSSDSSRCSSSSARERQTEYGVDAHTTTTKTSLQQRRMEGQALGGRTDRQTDGRADGVARRSAQLAVSELAVAGRPPTAPRCAAAAAAVPPTGSPPSMRSDGRVAGMGPRWQREECDGPASAAAAAGKQPIVSARLVRCAATAGSLRAGDSGRPTVGCMMERSCGGSISDSAESLPVEPPRRPH